MLWPFLTISFILCIRLETRLYTAGNAGLFSISIITKLKGEGYRQTAAVARLAEYN